MVRGAPSPGTSAWGDWDEGGAGQRAPLLLPLSPGRLRRRAAGRAAIGRSRACSVILRAVDVVTAQNLLGGDAKEEPMDLIWIIVIVLVVLALLGYFGRGRFR